MKVETDAVLVVFWRWEGAEVTSTSLEFLQCVCHTVKGSSSHMGRCLLQSVL